MSRMESSNMWNSHVSGSTILMIGLIIDRIWTESHKPIMVEYVNKVYNTRVNIIKWFNGYNSNKTYNGYGKFKYVE
jgi:hypothetical protein